MRQFCYICIALGRFYRTADVSTKRGRPHFSKTFTAVRDRALHAKTTPGAWVAWRCRKQGDKGDKGRGSRGGKL
jgi:hypothetical protein